MIAPDLLGHGKSDKPRADYSVAAYANGMRDLLSVLDVERVTVVGHSLGGGVAMQFAYQFPQLVDRLILVGAGGVTKDVNVALRIASLPMGTEALAVLRLPLVLPALQMLGRVGGPCSVRPAWAATCPTCCGSSPTSRSRRRRRRSPGRCAPWWTGGARSSPCWTDVI